MALVNCTECGKEVSTTATSCHHCGAKPPKEKGGSVGKVVVFALGSLGLLAVIGSMSNNRSRSNTYSGASSISPAEPEKPKDPIDNAHAILSEVIGYKNRKYQNEVVYGRSLSKVVCGEVSVEDGSGSGKYKPFSRYVVTDSAAIEDGSAKSNPLFGEWWSAQCRDGDAPLSSWRYYASSDKMTGKTALYATVSSKNYINFDSPYDGAQRGTLLVRKHPRLGKDVMISIEKGQFNCSYDGCTVLVRFDSGQPIRYQAGEPESSESTMLFLEDYKSFVGNLKKSKSVTVEASFYSQGPRMFEFESAGFDWK